MSRLKIIRLGHPALRRRSKPVSKPELRSKKFQKFLDDLAATCMAADGAGLAAPQVAINKRVIVVNVDPKNPRYPKQKRFPLTIVINPKVLRKSKIIKEGWEGDLSADIRGMVPRATSCVIIGLDRHGHKVKYNLRDFHARVFQHEIDHLDGIFLIDRVKRLETLSELAEWKKYWINKK